MRTVRYSPTRRSGRGSFALGARGFIELPSVDVMVPPIAVPTICEDQAMTTKPRIDRTAPRYIGAMSANREYMPWKATVTVLVGPLRCLATIRSASPARGLSFS